MPWREEYGGCTSWVDLDGLPDDPAHAPVRAGALRRRVRGPAEGRGRGAPRARPARRRALVSRARPIAEERPVAPVAGLGERVGPEGRELLRRQQLADSLPARRHRRRRGRTPPACACRRGSGSPRSASDGSSASPTVTSARSRPERRWERPKALPVSITAGNPPDGLRGGDQLPPVVWRRGGWIPPGGPARLTSPA